VSAILTAARSLRCSAFLNFFSLAAVVMPIIGAFFLLFDMAAIPAGDRPLTDACHHLSIGERSANEVAPKENAKILRPMTLW